MLKGNYKQSNNLNVSVSVNDFVLFDTALPSCTTYQIGHFRSLTFVDAVYGDKLNGPLATTLVHDTVLTLAHLLVQDKVFHGLNWLLGVTGVISDVGHWQSSRVETVRSVISFKFEQM